MKNLNEYKTEIYRRSQERIRKRTRMRKRLIALGASLCLCIIVGTAVLIPVIGTGWNQMLLDNRNENRTGATAGSNTSDGTMKESCCRVEIKGRDYHITIDDEDSITAITEYITTVYRYNYPEYSPLEESVVDKESIAEMYDALTPESASKDACTLTFVSNNGDEKDIILSGNLLRSEDDMVEFSLNDKQLKRFKVMLGVSE